MKKPEVGSFIQLHRENILSIKDDWSPLCSKNTVLVKVLEVFSQEDPDNILIRISISRDDDFEMIRDIIVNYSLKDIFLGEVLKEIDWFPNPISQDWLLGKGFTYSD